jgi:DNA-binding CsgD family transcriptional regulator
MERRGLGTTIRGAGISRVRPSDPTVAALALGLFAGVVCLRLLVDSPEAILLLLALPIALITRRFGPTAGLRMAGVAIGLVVANAVFRKSAATPLHLVLDAVVFVSIPLAFGSQARQPVAAAPAARYAPRSPQQSPPDALTKREVEVLRLIALGHTNPEIADELVVSVRTVEAHRARIQRKLGRSGRAELVSYALQHGLVET